MSNQEPPAGRRYLKIKNPNNTNQTIELWLACSDTNNQEFTLSHESPYFNQFMQLGQGLINEQPMSWVTEVSKTDRVESQILQKRSPGSLDQPHQLTASQQNPKENESGPISVDVQQIMLKTVTYQAREIPQPLNPKIFAQKYLISRRQSIEILGSAENTDFFKTKYKKGLRSSNRVSKKGKNSIAIEGDRPQNPNPANYCEAKINQPADDPNIVELETAPLIFGELTSKLPISAGPKDSAVRYLFILDENGNLLQWCLKNQKVVQNWRDLVRPLTIKSLLGRRNNSPFPDEPR